MAKPLEKRKAETPASAPQATSSGEKTPAKKRPTLLIVGAGALLASACGAGAFFLAPTTWSDSDKASVEKSKHAAASTNDPKAPHGAAKAGSPPLLGSFVVAAGTGFYMPDAFVVSLDPAAGVKHLKISLAIEAPPEAAAVYEGQSLRLRDVMTTYLRAVDVAALRSPAEMVALREQLKRRIQYVVSPDNVKNVLILDFILT